MNAGKHKLRPGKCGCAALLGVVIAVAAAGTAATSEKSSGTLISNLFGKVQNSPSIHDETHKAVPRKISALGYLEPQGETSHIFAPASMSNERIETILVHDGQIVQAGDPIALMGNRQILADEFREAEEHKMVCQAQLEQVRAGAKRGEIDAQSATIERLKADLKGRLSEAASQQLRLISEAKLADTEYKRYERLYAQGAVSASELDSRRSKMETSQARLHEAQAELVRLEETGKKSISEATGTLCRISEVRPVDLRVAEAQLHQAIARATSAKTRLELSCIRAANAGRIIKVWAHQGEPAGPGGIADIGQTERMVAVAEIDESDLRFIKKGQEALINSPAFEGHLRGSVSEIGWRVKKQNVYSNEPGANFDNRVVEVKIALSAQSSQRVQRLSGLQVEIELDGTKMSKNHEKNTDCLASTD